MKAALTVAPGRHAVYTLRLQRRYGFRGRVGVVATRVPRGARATWSDRFGHALRWQVRRAGRLSLITPRVSIARLDVATAATMAPGRYRFIVKGFARRLTTQLRLTLVVRTPSAPADGSGSFAIAGDAPAGLRPGLSVPLDLRLTNPYSFPISVTGLDVAVADATSAPDCSGGANYGIAAYSGPLPFTLAPGTTHLSDVVADPARWPAVFMRDLPVLQDACRGARIQLVYSGAAAR